MISGRATAGSVVPGGGLGGWATHPRHKGEDVVLLVLDDVFGELLLAFLRAAEPHRPRLQLLLPSTHVGQAVAAAEGEKIHTSSLN